MVERTTRKIHDNKNICSVDLRTFITLWYNKLRIAWRALEAIWVEERKILFSLFHSCQWSELRGINWWTSIWRITWLKTLHTCPLNLGACLISWFVLKILLGLYFIPWHPACSMVDGINDRKKKKNHVTRCFRFSSSWSVRNPVWQAA